MKGKIKNAEKIAYVGDFEDIIVKFASLVYYTLNLNPEDGINRREWTGESTGVQIFSLWTFLQLYNLN